MVAYLLNSDASEGFNQIIDFLNESSVKYALTMNPNIYVSCIKQFWTTVAVKQVNDVTRLQALVDRKKAVIIEATIRDALCLDNAEGVDCLPNENFFTELARMGYEKPSTKLTFYKAFFLSQWKFLIHNILQCMSAKRTSWNEFSSSMASAIICLYTCRKFNIFKYIFDRLVRNVDITTKFYTYPRFLQLIIKRQVGDLSTHTTKYASHALTQKVFANMKRVGKWFFGVETPLFEGILVEQEIKEAGDADEHVEEVTAGDDAHADDSATHGEVPIVTKEPSMPSLTPPTLPPQPPQDLPSTSPINGCAALTKRVEHLEYDKVAQDLEITKLKRRMKKVEMRNKLKRRMKKVEMRNKVKVLKLRRLQRVRTSQRVDTSDDTVMDDESNQGRMIAEMDKDDESQQLVMVEVEVMVVAPEVIMVVFVVHEMLKGDLEVVVVVERMKKLEKRNKVKVLKLRRLQRVRTSQRVDTSDDTVMDDESNQGRMIAEMDKDDVVVLMDDKDEDKNVKEAKVDEIPAATLTATPVRVAAAPSKRRKGVIIRDPEEESTTSTIIPAETKSKDKGKGILVEEPKPLKKKQQIEQDEQFARKLHAELNKDIDWDEAIDHVKLKAKEDPAVKRYQAMKRKPQTEAQARKNMVMYLKNVVGFKLDYFKGMSYDDIHPILEAKFNLNKAAKRRKLNEEMEDLKIHLQIVPNEDDDVYTKATPLARKVPVVDYKIIEINNKPYYKIIRADGTHQLYISFLTLLRNFNREDLEALWSLVKEIFSTAKPKNFSDDFLLNTLRAIEDLEALWSLVKERFSTTKPKNFSDDFLLNTLRAMFEKPDAHAQIWKN
nr:hypothetical protein [Tanacetum cinerariifolium]